MTERCLCSHAAGGSRTVFSLIIFSLCWMLQTRRFLWSAHTSGNRKLRYSWQWLSQVAVMPSSISLCLWDERRNSFYLISKDTSGGGEQVAMRQRLMRSDVRGRGPCSQWRCSCSGCEFVTAAAHRSQLAAAWTSAPLILKDNGVSAVLWITCAPTLTYHTMTVGSHLPTALLHPGKIHPLTTPLTIVWVAKMWFASGETL